MEAYRANLLKPKNWVTNITAGLIVGIVALPLAMAFAIASGVKPEQGLYTAIVAALFVSIFGGSRVQIAGPTGAFIVILANITAHYGVSGLQIASLMAGFILVIMGIAKLGSVIKFIPDPVIVGFTSGIGVIIFINEWKDFFGLDVHIRLDAHFYQKLWMLIKAFPSLNLTTTALGCLSLLLLWLTPKFLKRIPSPLVAMVVITVLQATFHFSNVVTIGSEFGGIPQYLPGFHFPTLELNHVLELVGPAFTIALLGAIESLLSAAAADGMAGTRHDSNQELIGQGLANIFSPLFGGFAATGAIARTATNVRNGGNSPIAAITHSIVLILIIILLAPLAESIPLCSLAAILFMVAYNMSDVPHFIRMLKIAPSYDVLVMVTTFLLTIFTNLVVAVNVGVILAMLFFVRSMIDTMGVEKQSHENLQADLAAAGNASLPANTLVYAIQGPFFFGVAEKIEHTLAAIHEDPKIIIFRLKYVPFMDITGLDTFKELIEHYHKRGTQVYLCEANQNVSAKLKNIGILLLIADKRLFETFADILKSIANPI
jgi:sulfate permease, SulP family